MNNDYFAQLKNKVLMKIPINKIIPHLIVIVVFLLITVVFFSPIFLKNQQIYQHDILQGIGAAKSLKTFRESFGEEGLWASSMFSGMPGYLVNTTYSGDLVIYVLKAYTLWLPHPTGYLFISFVSFYILLLAFRVRPYLSMAGAIAFGLTSFQIISLWAGHNAKVGAVAVMPLVLAGVHLAFNKKLGLGFVLTMIGMALEIRMNHLQITYFLLIIVVVYGLNELIFGLKDGIYKELFKPLALLMLAVIIGIGANFGKLWGVYEYSQYSTRGKSELTTQSYSADSGLDKDYAFQYSNGIFEPLFLFIPNFFGGSTSQELTTSSNVAEAFRRNGTPPQQIAQQVRSIPTYWGNQPSTLPYYAGAITIFLFVIGMLFLENRQRWWLLAIVIISIMLSWGNNFATFNYFLFDHLPVYNKFRSVTFTIIIAIVGLILGGFTGLERLITLGLNKSNQNKLLIGFAVTGGFSLLAAIFAGMGSYVGGIDARLSGSGYPDWLIDAIRLDRESLLRADAFRSFIFVTLAFVAIFFGLKNNSILKYSIMGIAFLVLLDMFFVARRFLDADSFSRNPQREFFAETSADKLLKTDPDNHFRVLNLPNPFNDARTSYHHRSIGGYHGAKLRRYQDVIEHHLDTEMNEIIEMVKTGNASFTAQGVLNMLDTRYFIAGLDQKGIIPNGHANGAAWFVQAVKKVSSPDQELDDIGNANTKTIAVVDTTKFEVHDSEGYFTAGTIELVQNYPNHLVYDVDASGQVFAIFSEIYYLEGWTATINGNEAPIIRANYILRALEIPQGKHKVEFKFAPTSYVIGNNIMMGFGIMMLIGAASILAFEIRRSLNQNQFLFNE